MLGSDILDAAIGLFLVYFLFSVLCSALNEWITGHLRGMRAKVLEVGIGRLLGGAATKDEFFKLPLVKSLTQKDSSKPSYLSGAIFVDGLVTLLKNRAEEAKPPLDAAALQGAGNDLESLRRLLDKLPGAELTLTLQSLLSGAKDMDEARQRLEAWFNEGMDRASGWYKKHTQAWTAGLALAIVCAFNVDTLTITRELLNDSRLRAVLVAAAAETVKQPVATNAPTGGTNNVWAMEKRIQELELPIGWAWRTNSINASTTPPTIDRTLLRPGEGWLMKIGGLLVTACAVSLGAPFWFDLIGRLINLRAAGRKPDVPKGEKKK